MRKNPRRHVVSASIGKRPRARFKLATVGVLLMFAAAAGCQTEIDANVDYEADVALQCPAHPAHLRGSTPAGGACSSPVDCLPTCCSCPGGPNSFLAAACSTTGTCRDATEYCEPLIRGDDGGVCALSLDMR